MYSDIETQIHLIEQEAYSAVLRAFKAQSDSITWEKESLMTDLRNELRVTDSEHRKLLLEVNGDGIIRRIREWQQAERTQVTAFHDVLPVTGFHDVLPSPTVSASRKKQKTSLLGTQVAALSTYKSVPYPSPLLPWNQHKTDYRELAETTSDSLTGRSMWSRQPAFETRRPEAICREGEDQGINHCGIHGESRMTSGIFIPIAERGRETVRGQPKREFMSIQNGITKKVSGNIELLDTHTVVKEVEKVFSVSHHDPIALEMARRMLKEHEHALVDAIQRLADTSDGESDGDQQPLM